VYKDAFTEYWNEAVTALIYEIHQMKGPVSEADIHKIWQRELLEHRFFSKGIRHGAAAWLESLEKADAEKAYALRIALSESKLTVGLNASQAGVGIAGAAATAGGSWLMSHSDSAIAKVGGIIASALGIGLMAKSGKDIYTASNAETLAGKIRKAADEQLSKITVLL